MTDFEDDPPNTPPPGHAVELPSIPPAPPLPGDFAATEQARTTPTPASQLPRGRTLTDEDLEAIADVNVREVAPRIEQAAAAAVNAAFDARAKVFADALKVVDRELQSVTKWVTGECRDNLASISEVKTSVVRIENAVNQLKGLWDAGFQQTTIVRRTVAPHVEVEVETHHELSPTRGQPAAAAVVELRTAPTEPPPGHEEDSTDPRS